MIEKKILKSFKQFLYEEQKSAEEIAEMIKRDCSPFLKEWRNYRPLFRGSKIDGNFQKFIVDKNRKPKHTNQEIHDALNDGMYDLTGIHYRTEAVFTTGDRRMAEEYGTPCLFFPIGHYNYLWSYKVNDAYNWFNLPLSAASQNYAVRSGAVKADPFKDMQSYLTQLKQFIVSPAAGYVHNSDLHEAIETGHEIMFACNSYYLITAYDISDQSVANQVLELL